MKRDLNKWKKIQRDSMLRYASKMRKHKKYHHKSPSLKSVKKEAWRVFSIYIRSSAADSDGNAVCITCGVKKHWKELQAGHFIPGRGNAILFDERGVHPQCYGCNIMKKGNPRKYDKWMKANYGQGVIDELDALADNPKGRKYTVPELQALITKYSKI